MSRSVLHVRRVHYQAAIWRRAYIAIAGVPSPTEGHGWTPNSGHLELLWVDGQILPQVIVNEMEKNDSADSDDGQSDDQEAPMFSDDIEDSDGAAD